MFNFLLTHSPLLYLTQSVWRDEAFSILVAERPIASFIGKLNFEPPIYYILLHFWMKIFGNSEIAARSLSLVGFSLATCVIIFWAEKMFEKHWLSWYLPIFFFLNPMLLYYGFEIRAYGWYIFFATLSLYAYVNKKYRLLALANILAFYTHSYAIFLPFVEVFHYLFLHARQKSFFKPLHLIKDTFFQSMLATGIIIGPWLLLLFHEMQQLKSTWYFPVDLQLVQSVLGNMFTSYDGTPGGIWGGTAVLSLLLLTLFFVALKNKAHKQVTSFFFSMIMLPLIIIIGISFVKPLFVNRYLIYVTISEVILVGYAIFSLKKHQTQKIVAGIFLFFIVLLNIFIPLPKAKLDIRSTIMEANALRGPNDLLFVSSPLIYFESEYYTKDRQHVFLYNPKHDPFPWYVGDIAFSQSQMAYDLPEYPQRAIIVSLDRTITLAYRTKPGTAITTNTTSPKIGKP